jgi:hypothetical protein
MPHWTRVTLYASSKRAKTRKTAGVSLNRRPSNRSLFVLLGKQKPKYHQKTASSPKSRRRRLLARQPRTILLLRVVRYQSRPAATRMSRSSSRRIGEKLTLEQRNTRTAARPKKPKQNVPNQIIPSPTSKSIIVTVKSLIRLLHPSRMEPRKWSAMMMPFATMWKSHRHRPSTASERTLEVTMIHLLLCPLRKRSPERLERIHSLCPQLQLIEIVIAFFPSGKCERSNL